MLSSLNHKFSTILVISGMIKEKIHGFVWCNAIRNAWMEFKDCVFIGNPNQTRHLGLIMRGRKYSEGTYHFTHTRVAQNSFRAACGHWRWGYKRSRSTSQTWHSCFDQYAKLQEGGHMRPLECIKGYIQWARVSRPATIGRVLSCRCRSPVPFIKVDVEATAQPDIPRHRRMVKTVDVQ